MKILMLGWELPPHNSGGLGVACFNLTHALSKQGASIDFVVPYQARHPSIDFMEIVPAVEIDPIFRFGNGAYESSKIMEKVIPGKKENNLLSIRDVQKEYCSFIGDYLKKNRPDVVHAHDWLTYEAGIVAKKNYSLPLVAHVHATEFDRAGMSTGNPLIHEIEREGLMLADRIIAVSEATRRIVHERYHIPLNKIEVVYNALDENYSKGEYAFDGSMYDFIRELKNDGYTIVSTVGRFTIQKGLKNLMQAAALAIEKNPKIMFIFAGDGEERNELIKLSAELGIAGNVLFTGFIRGKKLRDIYSMSDVFVMSSISEPFGLTALEAAHHGDALILTNQSGVSEVIWSALKYDFWDIHKLVDEILAVAGSKALLDNLQDDVKAEYSRITWDELAEKCLKIYNKLVKRKGF
ncbi:glycosyltransferase family 4 protein [Candidatus Saccharibacteria bacterium]|nr:glycosyltransferase family 4 protein [Candidatus Saccharibacteria bacterium]